MSDLLDETFLICSQTLNVSSQTQRGLPIDIDHQSKSVENDIVKNLHRLIPHLTNDYFIQSQNLSGSHIVKIRLAFNSCGLRAFNVFIDLHVDLSKKSICSSLTVLEGQRPYKIQSSSKRILICKLFCKSGLKNFNKMTVQMSSGSFKILKPSILFWESGFNEFIQGKTNEKNLINFIRTTLNEGVQTFKPLLRQLIEDFEDDLNQTRRASQDQIKRSIYRFIIKSSIEPSFQVSYGSGKYDTMQCLSKEEIFYTNSMAQNIVTNFEEFGTHSLYLTPKIRLENLKKLYVKEYFSSNDDELSSLKTKIEPPGNRQNMGFESKYVYNMIELNEGSQINLRKINAGGFSQISIADVEFWYMLSSNQRKMAKLEEVKKGREDIVTQTKLKRQNKKILVFKSNKHNAIQSGRNRVAHQMKIVSKFKGTPSIFIPEYFKIINQKSVFLEYLIMEHLPSPTLNEYAEIHKTSLSFLTKIHLACLIIHGLQTLKSNAIIHMDLKPSNVIVGKRMITKLIDFGESYNREVCEKNYKPAFSNPYGSPEIIDGLGKNEFTQKSDIYSWSILIFELLFRRLPFYLPFEKTTKVLKDKTYEKHIYFVPEEEGQYGSWEIMPLLRSVLFKAMDPDPKSRPFTIWLTVVLKECLTHLISLQLNSSNS